MTEIPQDKRAKRSAETRQALVKAARDLFAERGYADVSTGDIADRASMTRNAIYYHFPNKESIFRAVYEDVEAELAGRVVPESLAQPTVRGQLEVGCEVFLDGCLDPGLARISVLEAPGVLGSAQKHEIDSKNYLGALHEGIRAAIEGGEIPDLPVEALSSMLIGALDEAALLIAMAPEPRQARDDAGRVAKALIDGLFTSDPATS